MNGRKSRMSIGVATLLLSAAVSGAQTSQTVVSLVGDKDGFGTGQPCGFSYANVNELGTSSDATGTDVVLVASSYAPPLWQNPWVTSAARKTPQPLRHRFTLPPGAVIVGATLRLCTADIDDGAWEYINEQLFVDGAELPGAFDDVDQYLWGAEGKTGIVTFNLPASFFPRLADGSVDVVIDETTRSTQSADSSEVFAVDYSELTIAVQVPPGCHLGRWYANDADFDLGVLNDVNHNAPNHDQLQLDDDASSGQWTVVHDSGSAGTSWGRVSSYQSVLPGSALTIEVRAADTREDLATRPFREVERNVSFCGCDGPIVGRFIEVRTTFARWACAESPILHDLNVECCD